MTASQLESVVLGGAICGDTPESIADAVREALPVAAAMVAAGGALALADDLNANVFLESEAEVKAALARLDALGGELDDAVTALHVAANERAYALGLAVGLRLARLMED